jgi:hypothetical protein
MAGCAHGAATARSTGHNICHASFGSQALTLVEVETACARVRWAAVPALATRLDWGHAYHAFVEQRPPSKRKHHAGIHHRCGHRGSIEHAELSQSGFKLRDAKEDLQLEGR